MHPQTAARYSSGDERQRISPMARRRSNALYRRIRGVLTDRLRDVLFRVRSSFGIPHFRRGATAHSRRVLIVDDLVPDPLFGAGHPRAFAIVHALVGAGYSVDFYAMHAARRDIVRMHEIFAGKVHFHPSRKGFGLRRLLQREGARFQVIFVSRPSPMKAFLQARWQPANAQPAPVIYDAEAVLTPREARRRALFGLSWSEADYNASLLAELGPARAALAVTAIGRTDAELIKSVIGMPVFVLPHPVVIRTGSRGFAERRDFLFVGRLSGLASQSPNVDSMFWFATEVMPLLDQLIGVNYRIHVAGRVDAHEITALASKRFVLHGGVEDLRPLYDQCRVFVAPTRYAAGLPLKVVEAMGEGIPCVVTPLLAEQLAAHDDAVAIGEGAQGFAEQCARLFSEPATWKKTRSGGTAHVERSCSADAFSRVLGEAFDYVAQKPGDLSFQTLIT